MGKAGKLVSALEQLPDSRKGPRCGVAIACDQLPAEDRVEFISALANPNWSSRMITTAMKNAHGVIVPYATVTRHSGGHCQCQD